MIQLLQDEQELASVRGGNYEVVLTDWRAVAKGTSLGADSEQVIPLDSVDSLFVGTSRNNLFLLLGVLFAVGFFGVQEVALLALATLMFALWWFLAKRGAQIISRSGKTIITLEAARTNFEAVTQFVMVVQRTLRAHKAL